MSGSRSISSREPSWSTSAMPALLHAPGAGLVDQLVGRRRGGSAPRGPPPAASPPSWTGTIMASVCHWRPSGSSKTRKWVHRSSQWIGAHRKKMPVKFRRRGPGRGRVARPGGRPRSGPWCRASWPASTFSVLAGVGDLALPAAELGEAGRVEHQPVVPDQGLAPLLHRRGAGGEGEVGGDAGLVVVQHQRGSGPWARGSAARRARRSGRWAPAACAGSRGRRAARRRGRSRTRSPGSRGSGTGTWRCRSRTRRPGRSR